MSPDRHSSPDLGVHLAAVFAALAVAGFLVVASPAPAGPGVISPPVDIPEPVLLVPPVPPVAVPGAPPPIPPVVAPQHLVPKPPPPSVPSFNVGDDLTYQARMIGYLCAAKQLFCDPRVWTDLSPPAP